MTATGVREPFEIASDDGLCRLLFTTAEHREPGEPPESFTVDLELGDLRAAVRVEVPETEALLSLFRCAADGSGGEWQSSGGEVVLRVTSAGLEVELWHAFAPTWSAAGVIPMGREVLAKHAVDLAGFLG